MSRDYVFGLLTAILFVHLAVEFYIHQKTISTETTFSAAHASLPRLTRPQECVYYRKPYDSHKAAQGNKYVFVTDGVYLVKNKDSISKLKVRAGEAITIPDEVVGEGCGPVFLALLKELESL